MKFAAANLLLNAPDLVTGETTDPHTAQKASLELFLAEVAPALRAELPSRAWRATEAVPA